jgi:hypothetical protein
VFIGAAPRTDWLEGVVGRDARGFILAGSDAKAAGLPLKRDPYVLETTVPGVFVAGDVPLALDQARGQRRRGGLDGRVADPRVPGGAMTIDELRRIDLFDGIDDDELDRWRAAAEEQTFKEGDRVIAQGEAPLGLYLLLEGSLESMFVIDGRTEHIGHQNSPTWIGAIAALTDQELGLTMDAETDVRLALIPREQFVDLARQTASCTSGS